MCCVAIRQSGAPASQDPDGATSLWSERNPCTPNQRSLVPWQDKPFNVRMPITARDSFPFTWGQGVVSCLKNKGASKRPQFQKLNSAHLFRPCMFTGIFRPQFCTLQDLQKWLIWVDGLFQTRMVLWWVSSHRGCFSSTCRDFVYRQDFLFLQELGMLSLDRGRESNFGVLVLCNRWFAFA